MEIVFAKQSFPSSITKSIFLAGPTPRSKNILSWRTDALRALAVWGYGGTVFVPEPEDGIWYRDPNALYDSVQVEWEEAALKRADCILFWIPRDVATLPGFTTNDEFGVWKTSGKVVLGTPEGADHVKYQNYYAGKLKIPLAHTLEETVRLALAMVGEGAKREGGECEVPLLLWQNKTFQGWLTAQRGAGNRLDGANILWTYRIGDSVFAWVAHVNVWIESEGRYKTNEFVFGRTDVSGVVLYSLPKSDEGGRLTPETAPAYGKNFFLDTEVIIVREFRSPARTPDGFIWEIPAGSSKDTEEDTLSVALHEVEEEVGLKLDPSHLWRVGSRQVAGTLLAHQATIYAVELMSWQLDEVKRTLGLARGVEEDTERTYAHVLTVRQLLTGDHADWATLGMVLSGLILQ